VTQNAVVALDLHIVLEKKLVVVGVAGITDGSFCLSSGSMFYASSKSMAGNRCTASAGSSRRLSCTALAKGDKIPLMSGFA
jgi:hypothetical protein